MEWIYLSPHFDDIALSCGGLVWEQADAGDKVQVWTICAGELPPRPLSAFAMSLHARWQTGPEAVIQRRQEDIASCEAMRANFRHFNLPDCIYRPHDQQTPHYYDSAEALFGEINPAETTLVAELTALLEQALPESVQVICPLSLGGHVDHRLVRAAAERLKRPLLYYADYPYVLKTQLELDDLARSGWRRLPHSISPAGLEAWIAAVAAHRSQISTFWPDAASLRQAITEYAAGLNLWQR